MNPKGRDKQGCGTNKPTTFIHRGKYMSNDKKTKNVTNRTKNVTNKAIVAPRNIVPPAAFEAHAFAPAVGAPVPHLQNHGGPIIGSVEVVPVYWGNAWTSGINAQLANQLNGFFDFLVTSSYMDMLAEYGTATTPIRHGRRLASATINSEPGTPSGTGRVVTDAQIQQSLNGWIANHTVAATTANTLYFIFLPPNVISQMSDGSASCSAFCGYHNFIGNVYYAVIPFATCAGCVFPGNFLDTLTEVCSHEFAEAITDPQLNAWWDPASGSEIGDICNRNTVRLGGFLVQTEWSNAQSACVIAPATPHGIIQKVILGDTSPLSPCLASLNNNLFLGWKGDGNDFLNVMYSADNGRTFAHKHTSNETSPQSPAICAHNGKLFIAWKGDGNDFLNVAQITISGGAITGFVSKITLGDTSPFGPSLASLNGRLYLAWKGNGNNLLNIMYSTDDGHTFGNKFTSPETSAVAPVICAHNGRLYIGWKGNGNNLLNVAQVVTVGNAVTGFTQKRTLTETSPANPSLASVGNRLYLGWRGDGNTLLNVMYSSDNGQTFAHKHTSPESSPQAPGLGSHQGQCYIAWKGNGNDNLNVAQVFI